MFKKISILFLALIISCSFIGIAYGQQELENIYSYISSDDVSFSSFINVKNLLKLLNVDYKTILNKKDSSSDDNIFNGLLKQGLDLISNTDYIFLTSGPKISNFDMKDSDFMIVTFGNYPIAPFSAYFKTKDKFVESGDNNFKIFQSQSEDLNIFIINQKVILVSHILFSEKAKDIITNGNNSKKGNFKKIIDKARKSYNVLFVAGNLKALDRIDLTEYKNYLLKTKLINEKNEFPESILLIEGVLGISLANDGFNVEVRVKGENEKDIKAVAPTLKMTLKLGVAIIEGLLLGNENTNGEDDGDNNNSNNISKKLTKEQKEELINFLKSLSIGYKKDEIIFKCKIKSSLLKVIKDLIEKQL